MENTKDDMTLTTAQQTEAQSNRSAESEEIKIPKPDTLSLYTNMKEALGSSDYDKVISLYEEALKLDHPKGLPQYCLGYYIMALYAQGRTDKVVEMEEYRMEYDKYTQEDVDTYITTAKANIMEKKFEQALLDLEKAYEHSYFTNGKDDPQTDRILKMQILTSLTVRQTKKTLILASNIPSSAFPAIEFVYMKAYARWNDNVQIMKHKTSFESCGENIKTVVADLFGDEKVGKQVLDNIKE